MINFIPHTIAMQSLMPLLFKNMNVHSIMNTGSKIALIILTIDVILTYITVYLSKEDILSPGLRKTAKVICFLILDIALAIMIITLIITTKYKTAVKHGAYTDDMTVKTMYDGIKYSPIESKLPDNLEGCIVLYYRFDCPDCHAVYNDLSAAVKDKDSIYWVSTRSEQGKALLAQYPVNEVPSGIYFRKNTYSDALTYTKKVLYTTDSSENTVLYKDNLNRLLELQSSTQ